jgi:probable HAF family extracellular repeat protein
MLFTAAVFLEAQQGLSQDNKPRHKQYRLIDLGTFGGHESWIYDIARSANNQGVVIGESETTVPFDPTSFVACTFGAATATYVTHAFAAANGIAMDLGALPPVAQHCSTAFWISDNGNIAGASENGVVDPDLNMSETRAVLWSKGQLLNLGTFGGSWSVGLSVNNAGQATGFALNTVPDAYSIWGYFYLGSNSSTQTRAFVWDQGKLQDLGSIGGGNAIGFVINDPGEVAGNAYVNDTPNDTTGLPTMDPFFWKNGKMTDLGSLGGVLSLVNNMNNKGQVVGISDLAGDEAYHAFVSDKGKLKDLGTLGGSTSEPRWINNSGEAVGGADFPGDKVHDAVVWKNGTVMDLGNLGFTSFAHANNNAGQVVGASRIQPGSNSSAIIHAWLWENGGPMVDLNDLIPANSSLVLEYADYMNDRGWITGVGTPAGCNDTDDGCGHAFVLVPDGDCDSSCQSRIGASQARVEATHSALALNPPAPSRPVLTPAERARAMMRRSLHLPGPSPLPRD